MRSKGKIEVTDDLPHSSNGHKDNKMYITKNELAAVMQHGTSKTLIEPSLMIFAPIYHPLI